MTWRTLRGNDRESSCDGLAIFDYDESWVIWTCNMNLLRQDNNNARYSLRWTQ